MQSSKLFSENLDRWKIFCPEGAEKVEKIKKIEPSHLPIQDEDLSKWKEGIDFVGINVLYLYGLQNGKPFEALKPWLDESLDHFLVVLEDDLEVIFNFLHTEAAKTFLNTPRVYLYHVETTLQSLSFSFVELFPFLPYRVVASPQYLQSKFLPLKIITDKIYFYDQAVSASKGEYLEGGSLVFKNFGLNMSELAKSCFAMPLYGKFKDIPAIICAAGPSIDKQLPLLKTLKDNALIFAGGTAINALSSGGVTPHFCVGIDPNYDQFTRLIMSSAFEAPFFYCSRMNDEALKMVHGDKLYVSGIGGHKIISWLENKLDIASFPMSVGLNVINFSLCLARHLGCNPIILVGIDLAYTDVKSYSGGFRLHPIHHPRYFYKTKKIDEEVLVRPDIYGKPTQTLWKWVAESGWYTDFATENPEIKLYNCTEGGIGFFKIPNMPFKEATDKFLTEKRNLDSMVQGEIELARLSKKVEAGKVSELLDLFVESLKRCAAICLALSEKLRQRAFLNVAWKEDFFEKEYQSELTELKKETAYENLLETFNLVYESFVKRDLLNVKLQADKIDPVEAGRQLLKIYSDRYLALYKTAEINVNTLSPKKTEEKTAEKRIENPSEYFSGVYLSQNGRLKIDDPALGILIDEEFTPDAPLQGPRSRAEECIQETRKKGALHGRSAFLSPSGQVIASQWYYRGKKMGRGEVYYLSSKIKSIHGFVDGLEEGVQTYFYPDSSLKAQIPYKKGQIDGKVCLYYENGLLERELHFKEGVRHGVEKCYTPDGTLTIEVDFENGLGKGIARAWYPNGAPKIEIDYSTPESEVIRAWNTKGEPVFQEAADKKDFYYQVAKQTDLVTSSIRQVYNQIVTLGSLTTLDKGDKTVLNDGKAASLIDGLKNLQEQMNELEKKGKQLNDLVAIDRDSPEEPLWKSPQQKREIEKLADKLSYEMRKELGKIDQELRKIFDNAQKNDQLKPPS